MITPYQEILTTLEAGLRALPQAEAPVLPSEIVRWTRGLAFSDVRAADEACDRFATMREWPAMTNNVLAQMHLRVEAAIDLCRGMMQLGKPPMPFGHDEAVQMLLVHYWHSKGPEWVEWRYGGQRPLPETDPRQN